MVRVPTPLRSRALRRTLLVVGIGALAIVVVSIFGPAESARSFRAEGEPRPIPPDQLASVTGEEFEGILVGRRGRPVVVNVWASWCPPCRAEMPLLARTAGAYDDVVVLGVAARDDPDAARQFLEEVGVDYPNGRGDLHRARPGPPAAPERRG